MKFVYIASRVRGDLKKNLALAREYCRFAVNEKVIPIVPHIMLDGVLDDDNEPERDKALEIGKALLSKCDEMWVFTDSRGISDGMRAEMELATELQIPMYRVDWEEVLRNQEDKRYDEENEECF